MTYEVLTAEQVEPPIHTDLSLEKMESATASIVRMQHVMDRLPLLRRINLMGLLQAVTPASVQRKLAVKKAVQAAQYLGEHNRACIAFWREHGITSLDFLDPADANTLRQLPIMTSDFFYRYAPEDRFLRDSGDAEALTVLSSSGSTGEPKLFLTCPEDAQQTLPAMTQFLRTNWKIDAFDRVEIIVHTIRAEPGEPQWGAGYNMTRLLSLIAKDYPYIHFQHLTQIDDTVARIRQVLAGAKAQTGERTLIALYTYPPDAAEIVRKLTDFGRDFEDHPQVSFKITLTGEAIPPYRIFQMAEWLRIVEAGFSDRSLADMLADARGRQQLRTLAENFSTGFGAAEIQTGVSGSVGTMVWTLVMALLQRNEPERVDPFLEKYFDGRAFPWSILKASPNVFFLLGSADEEGETSLDAPPPEVHSGPAFATALAGAVVNCELDYMHIWDMGALADRLMETSGVDMRAIFRQIGLRYEAGDMVLTNGRIDSSSAGGLDAAISWGGQSIYGHNFHTVAARLPGLSGRFTAQSLDYSDGERVFWVHFEADRGENLATLQPRVAKEAVGILSDVNAEFAHRRKLLLNEGGDARFRRTFRIRVLPYNHPRFQRAPGRRKLKYIRKPQYIEVAVEDVDDPIAEGLITG